MQDFKKLVVWQKAHTFGLSVYRVCTPETFATFSTLRSQVLRSSASISANIAEGTAKTSNTDFARFLEIAIGSAKETENHLLFARGLGPLVEKDFDQLLSELEEVRRMLIALVRAVRNRKK